MESGIVQVGVRGAAYAVLTTGERMSKGTPDDFRYPAERESVRLMGEMRLSSAMNSETSLCMPLEGDATGKLYQMAAIPMVLLVIGLLLILFAVVYVVLIVTPWVDASWRTFLVAGGALTVGVVLAVASEGVSKGLFEGILEGRHGRGVMGELRERVAECFEFAIEDPATCRNQKVISEDYALGGLDRSGGLVLAGVQYWYVIRPRDVIEVRVDRKHVLITAKVGGASLTIAASPLAGDEERETALRREIVAALEAADRRTAVASGGEST
jgi:hypothetical protein